MVRVGRSVLLAVAVLVAFWLIWSKLHIFVFVITPFSSIFWLFVILAVVLFLGLDHLINRTRSR